MQGSSLKIHGVADKCVRYKGTVSLCSAARQANHSMCVSFSFSMCHFSIFQAIQFLSSEVAHIDG
jgi:hypothetical protein